MTGNSPARCARVVRRLRSLALGFVLSAAGIAPANFYLWDDPSGSAYRWSPPENWSGGDMPQSNSATELSFEHDLDGKMLSDLGHPGGGPFRLGFMTLADRAGGWTATGRDIYFSNLSSRLRSRGGDSSFAFNILLRGSLEAQVDAGTLSVANFMSGEPTDITVLRKTGAGTLEAGAFLIVTELRIDDGTLRLIPTNAHANRFPSLKLGGGNFDLNGRENFEVSDIFIGSGEGGSFGAIVGQGSVNLMNSITFLGDRGGIQGTSREGTLGGTINLVGARSAIIDENFTTSFADATLSGVLTGSGSLRKDGRGTLVLTGANNYAGSTEIAQGGLWVRGDNVLPDSTSLIVRKSTPENTGGFVQFGKTVGGGGLNQRIGSLEGDGIVQLARTMLTIGSNHRSTEFSGNLGVGGYSRTGTLTRREDDASRFEVASVRYGFTKSADAEERKLSGITKVGSGTLTLSGANYLPLLLDVREGTLRVGSHGDLGTPGGYADLRLTGGTVDLNGFAPTAQSLILGDGMSGGLGTLTGGTLNLAGDARLTPLASGVGRVASFASHLALSSGDHAFNVGANDRLTVSGSLSGAGRLVKTGTGTQALTATNTYAGGTSVEQGRLIVSRPHGDYANGSVLEIANNDAQALSGVVSGGGRLEKTGAGTLILSGANTHTGSTAIHAGTLRVGSANALGSGDLVLAGGTFNQGGVRTSVRSLYLGDGNVTSAGTLLSGTLDVTGDVVFRGAAGRQTGPVTIEPSLVLSSGTHRISDNGNRSSGPYDLVFSNGISGAGALTKAGIGTIALLAASTYTGGTSIEGGTLFAGTANALPTNTALSISSGATFSLNPTVSANGVTARSYGQTLGSLSGNGMVALGTAILKVGSNNADTTFAGVISGGGSLEKIGAGTLILSGQNTYTGGTAVREGILRLAHTGALGSGDLFLTGGTLNPAGYRPTVRGLYLGDGAATSVGTIYPGTLDLTGDVVFRGASGMQTRPVTLESDLALSSGTHRLSDNGNRSHGPVDVTLSGVLSGSGAIEKTGSGTFELSGTNTYSGGTTITAGTLVASRRKALGTGAVTILGELRNSSGGDLALSSATNGGAVTTDAGSTTRFAGAVTGAGGFLGTGAVAFDGGYSPGDSPADVLFGGDLRLGSDNVLTMELGGTGYDHLTVSGATSLDGTLNVAYHGGFAATAGQSFNLFDFGTVSGTFASIHLPTLSDGLFWDTSALYTTGTLSVQAVPEPASLAALGLGALALLRRRRPHALRV